MGLILGIYGTTTLQLGPYSSVLIKVNSIFVQSIKVRFLPYLSFYYVYLNPFELNDLMNKQAEQIDEAKPGIMLYGFDEEPYLGVKTNWSRSYNGSVPHKFYKASFTFSF